MRTKAHRYSASAPLATTTNNTDVVGVTGDFDGGHVQANAFISGTPGVGNYIGGQFKLDGVIQGPQAFAYQAVAGSVVVVHAVTLRVPQGRHRISVLFTTSATPLGITAEVSVAELNA